MLHCVRSGGFAATSGRLQTGGGHSLRDSECRRLPKPALRLLPRPVTALPRKLPEYANFAGMRCEIQVQTILNHAWAEMAQDTVYKAPKLGDFGARHFDSIKKRLHKVARKYLLPAG